MLESLAATLLNRVLGSYVENFDPTQLNVGIWSGDVKLKNLKLRKDCLDSLELPIDVVQGVLGQLVLNVPWSSLKNKPVKIAIEDCYLICSPRNQTINADILERHFQLKLKKLMTWELGNKNRLANSNSGSSSSDDSMIVENKDTKDNESFMQSLITKVIDNLQVVIKNIHVRFEDVNTQVTKFPTSIGITLREISAISANSNWEPSFIEFYTNLTHKLLTLDSLAIYWDTNAISLNNDDNNIEQFIDNLKAVIHDQEDQNYLLAPVTALGKLIVNKLGTTEELPHIDLQLLCDEFGIELDDMEYTDLLSMISNLHLQKQIAKYKVNRPVCAVRDDPKSWFKYIAECVQTEVHEKNKMWTWNQIKLRTQQRKQYVELWKQKLELPSLEDKLTNSESEKNLDQLQRDLPFEMITLFRMIAKRDFAKDKLSSKESSLQPSESKIEEIEQEGSNWLSSWWGGASKNSNGSSNNDLVMTEEQKKELYAAIEFNENEISSSNIAIPEHLTKLKITGILKEGFFSLKSKQSNSIIGSINYKDCKLEFLKRPESFVASFDLKECRVEDGAKDSIFKQIVSPKISTDKNENIPPLFHIAYESNPLDKSADSKLDLKVLGTTIYYNVYFFTNIMKFFQSQREDMDTIGAIISAAETTVEGWTNQTRMGIESLLDEHKTLDLNLDMQAPLLILPVNPREWNSPCTIVDAGHISMISEVVPREKIEEIKNMSVEAYDKIDDSSINRLLFDRYKIVSQDTQILVGPSVETTISSISESLESNNFCILHKMRLDITLDLSILPKAHKLPKIRISGKLPKLSLAYNDYQYKILIELFQNLIPQTDYFVTDSTDSTILNDEFMIEQARLNDLYQVIQKMSESEIEQKQLDIDFEVGEVIFSLLKCTDEQTMQCKKLADLSGDAFKFNFIKKVKEMNLDVSIHSLNVQDFIQKSAIEEFNYLISSDIVSEKGTNDIFNFQYTRTQRFVIHESTLIEVYDQDLNMNLTKLKLVVTPKSILTLLNYTILTFTNPEQVEMPADVLKHNTADKDDSPQKFKMNINMEGLLILFNDDNVKLATIELFAGDFMMLLLPTKMKLGLKVGGLDLTDECSTVETHASVFRKLITMDGNQLMQLDYETFDCETNKLDYDSLLTCVTESMFVNFNDKSINRLLVFISKFQKMKSYFDNARQAAYDQVPAIETVKNMKLDVVIKAPIIQFPRINDLDSDSFDIIKFYLGELFLKNDFIISDRNSKINKIKTGLRDGQIASILILGESKTQKLYLAEGMNFLFDISHYPFSKKTSPEFEINGNLDGLDLNLTELQLKYLQDILNSIQDAFTIKEVTPTEISPALTDINEMLSTSVHSQAASKNKQLGTDPVVQLGKSYKIKFNAPSISLTLYDNTTNCIDIAEFSITKLTLQDIVFDYSCKCDGSASGEAYVTAFKIEDTRNMKDNKHTELIPKMDKDGRQFYSTVSRRRLETGLLTNLSVTVNSPRFILAMDHLMAIKQFFDIIAVPKNRLELEEEDKEQEEVKIFEGVANDNISDPNHLFQYSLNIVDSAIELLADPADVNTEAVVFSIGQLLFTEQNISTLTANNVGIFLKKMNSSEENVIRLLDDFSSSVTIDRRNSTYTRHLTQIHGSVEPITMRISLRDIRLAMLIFNRAAKLLEQYTKHLQNADEIDNEDTPKHKIFSKEFEKKLVKYSPSFRINEHNESNEDLLSSNTPVVELNGETMTADFGGLRVILLGDIHEMPILETTIEPFSMNVKDWSTNLDGLLTMKTAVNIFNYSRSSWEPLIESTDVSLHMSKGKNADDTTFIDVITRDITEITLSSRSIAALSNIPASLNSEIALKPRGFKKPYLLINDTGLDLDVWIKGDNNNERNKFTTIKANSSLPWEFEDWRSIRERLDTDNNKNILNVKVNGTRYSTIMTIDATGEGEHLHVLKPAVNTIHRRIICDLKCNDENVKVIIFRSTLLLENTTCTKIQVRVESPELSAPLIYVIKPSSHQSVSVEYAYSSKLYFRPETDSDFAWSEDGISWNDLLTKPVSIKCNSLNNSSDRFFIELNGKYDKKEPLAQIFPHIKIIISPSLIIENMLPCDMNFCVFSKRDDLRNYLPLAKAKKVAIHSASLDEFLLLAIQPMLEANPTSKPSIINTPEKTALKPEDIITLNVGNGQTLNLKIKYRSIEGSRAKILKIYSPYIVLNKTNKDLFIEGENFNMAQSQLITEDDKQFTNPMMFSFATTTRINRAKLKFKETDWSNPLSFDALGQAFDTSLNSINKAQESNLGINISEGLGNYRLSKVVTISPRYIIKNELEFPIDVCELGSVDSVTIEAHQSKPLYNMRKVINKQLMIKSLSYESEWSAPFFLKDIGLTYVKLLTDKGKHMLLKLEIALQDATIFVKIKAGNDIWPYSIRNFSDHEFIFYQRDLKLVDEHYEEEKSDNDNESLEIEYKPLYYRVPPRSVMPYAWDYPTARQRKLIITSRGRKREIQLAEIGNLKPMRLPGESEDDGPSIVDLNVVADGPTQALVITNYDPNVSLYRLRDRNNSSRRVLNQSSSSIISGSDRFESKESNERIFSKIVLSVKGLGISLINTNLQELMYINVGGIELRYNDSELYKTFSWKLKWLQVDNQLFGATYPNILYPAAIPNTRKEIENHPVFSGSVSRVKDDSYGLPYFKHVTFLLQEFAIQLDEDFIYALIDFVKFPGASWNNNNSEETLLEEQITLPTIKDVTFANDIYFEIFHIQPTLLHLSFVRTERLHQNDENDISKQEVSNGSTGMFFFNVLTMTVGNVNDAPIKLNSLLLDNVRVPISMLIDSIKTHYSQQFIYQIHMILGSADILGNPVGLFNTISSGVWDLFYEPYQGYMLNDRPEEIGIHIAKGGLSFAKKTVFGISDSMAKFTGSVAKGLSVTQDSRFQDSRRVQQRIMNNGNVLANTATSFINTVGSGITGLAMDPVRGGQEEGAAGFIKGVGRGIFGLPTKTAIGILDLTSNLSSGVRKTTTALDGGTVATRARLPRYIDPHEQIIRSYNTRESQGQHWLKISNGGMFLKDHYLAHTVLPGRELVVVVSMERIAEIKISTQEVMWGTAYSSIQGISVEDGGIRIKLKSQSEYFIPIQNADEKKYVYKNIKVAVLEYNRYCEASL